jgi:hypothetical protein
MKKKYKIIGLYEANDVYQVIDTAKDSVLFQGSNADCKKNLKLKLKKQKNEKFDK